ncbi:MAG: phosphopentomutase [Actinomycetota bacterium]|nr:phosphopentomutase [Actinomycetota bacterium]
MKNIVIVLDGVGGGSAPDSARYGDAGADTLGHVLAANPGIKLTNLYALGLGNTRPLAGVPENPRAIASCGLMRELSAGKDTITGHWEMMGIVNETAFPTYPSGFPPDVISGFERQTGRKVLGNVPASGTEIIEKFGPAHIDTGAVIVYTSADSVFQIAAHVDVIPVEELYAICRTARQLLVAPHHVCRVIARPFTGVAGAFRRIPEKRKDFPFLPPGRTVIDALAESGVPVYSIGKVGEMFSMRGFAGTVKTRNNAEGISMLADRMKTGEDCFIFANLNDFDSLYGHRNDAAGFAKGLEEFDRALPLIMDNMGAKDRLFITADHGCDPTFPGTDHTRELVPVIYYSRPVKTGAASAPPLNLINGFVHIGASIAENFGVDWKLEKN